MPRIELEQGQIAEPIDDATRAALEIGLAQLERGEVHSLEDVRESIKKRAQAWRKNQKIAVPA